jgi:16S rRNA G527 N7-methylase RsmG
MEPTRDWILCDSEKRKTDFLADAVGRLGLERVRTVWGRADILLQSEPVDTVVSRAVGPVERIYGWISKCSTWNRLLLLKGPNWAQEWQTFIDYSGGKPPLRVEKEWKYEVGPESKSRTLVFLTRTN